MPPGWLQNKKNKAELLVFSAVSPENELVAVFYIIGRSEWFN